MKRETKPEREAEDYASAVSDDGSLVVAVLCTQDDQVRVTPRYWLLCVMNTETIQFIANVYFFSMTHCG